MYGDIELSNIYCVDLQPMHVENCMLYYLTILTLVTHIQF
jgi:hypothetical protein